MAAFSAGSKAAQDWWNVYQKEQNRITLIMLIVFFPILLILNPIFHKTFDILQVLMKSIFTTNSEALTQNPFPYSISLIVIFITLILIPSGLAAIISMMNRANEEIGFYWLPKIMSKSDINYSVMPAYKIRSVRKTKVFQSFKEPQNFYQIAETREYVSDNYLIRVNFKKRLALLFLASLMINSIFAFIISEVSWPYLFMFSTILTALLLVTEVLISGIYNHKQAKLLNKVITQSPKSADQVWAEYKFTFNLASSPYSHGHIVMQGTTLEYLQWQAMFSCPALEGLLKEITVVSNQAYMAMNTINDIRGDGVTRVDNTFHKNNIKQLKKVVEVFIPTCIKEILNDIKYSPNAELFGTSNYESTHEHRSQPFNLSNDLSVEEGGLIDLYDIIYNNIKKQKDIISKIQTYYDQIINMAKISSMVNDIKGQDENDNVEGYSLKLAVLNQKLNYTVIPQLKAMLPGADEETKTKIQNKIKEVSVFFKEQVALEEQLHSNNALDYDRTIDVNNNLNSISVKSNVDTYLTNLDYYLKELDKHW